MGPDAVTLLVRAFELEYITVNLAFVTGLVSFMSSIGLRTWIQFGDLHPKMGRALSLLTVTFVMNMVAYFHTTITPRNGIFSLGIPGLLGRFVVLCEKTVPLNPPTPRSVEILRPAHSSSSLANECTGRFPPFPSHHGHRMQMFITLVLSAFYRWRRSHGLHISHSARCAISSEGTVHPLQDFPWISYQGWVPKRRLGAAGNRIGTQRPMSRTRLVEAVFLNEYRAGASKRGDIFTRQRIAIDAVRSQTRGGRRPPS